LHQLTQPVVRNATELVVKGLIAAIVILKCIQNANMQTIDLAQSLNDFASCRSGSYKLSALNMQKQCKIYVLIRIVPNLFENVNINVN
jgi:hypothetical protein